MYAYPSGSTLTLRFFTFPLGFAILTKSILKDVYKNYFVTFFLFATVLRLPLRVRALVCVL